MNQQLQRIPPHNDEAEKSVLGAVLLDKEVFFLVSEILEADDFYSHAHREIFQGMVDLHQRDEPIDAVTLSDSLIRRKSLEAVGGRGYIALLSNVVPTTANAVQYAKIVREKSVLRRLIQVASDIVEKSYEEKLESEQVLDHAEQTIFEVAGKRQSSQYVTLREVLNKNIDNIQEAERSGGAIPGLSTGFSDLDRVTTGLQKSDLIIVAARPSMGKTAFALNIAQNVAIKQKPDGASVSRQEQRLISRVMAGDVPGTRNQTTIWLKELIDFEDSLDSVKSNVFRVLLNARMCASEAHKGYATKAIFNTSFALINNCSTYEEFSNYILPQITECASLLCESNNAKQNPVILRVKEYIEEHIATEISLETVADFVSVNPVYLSKLFKDETGENFIDFVTGLRLEKACALLVSSELSIKEISHKTGYSDQNYFSKLFRRKFNLTPTEYRNSRM